MRRDHSLILTALAGFSLITHVQAQEAPADSTAQQEAPAEERQGATTTPAGVPAAPAADTPQPAPAADTAQAATDQGPPVDEQATDQQAPTDAGEPASETPQP